MSPPLAQRQQPTSMYQSGQQPLIMEQQQLMQPLEEKPLGYDDAMMGIPAQQ